MPRTKRVLGKKRSTSILNIKPDKKKLDKATIDIYLKKLDQTVEMKFIAMECDLHKSHVELAAKLSQLAMKLHKDNHKTIAELRSEWYVENETARTFANNTTRTLQKTRGRPRSSSVDRSAQNTTVQKSKSSRASRSLSRQTKNNFQTPMLKPPNQHFGSVTPKVKPNAPQVVLRRPKQGEIAISMQGSPLMVSSITSDCIPNINIPLQDGRMIAIQPERGLRYSELPLFDEETQRNLERLRDNLNKVCGRKA